MILQKIIRRLVSETKNFAQESKLKAIVSDKKLLYPPIDSDKTFRVAVIGAGAMGRDQCLGMQKIAQVEIVAVADRNNEAIERIQRQVNLSKTRFYSDAAELFDKEEIDLVCIATNTNSHIMLTEMAIDKRIPRIIIEKPIGNNVHKAYNLVNKIEGSKIKVAVNHSRRWSNTYVAIKKCILMGYIGNLKQIYSIPGPGGFAMVGSHLIDIAAFLGDSKIKWAAGSLDKEIGPNKRGIDFFDPGGYATLGLENNIRIYIDLSEDLIRKSKFMVLYGESGRIEIDERTGIWHLINDMFQRKSFSFIGPVKPAEYFTKVVLEILSSEPSSCSADDSLNTLEAIIAIHISDNRNYQRIYLPLDTEDDKMELNFP